MAEWIRFGLSAVLILSGLFVLISAVLGIYRFRYALNRIHAGALADTIGILLMLGGVMVAEGLTLTTLKMAVVIGFLWLTSPVSSHLIGRMEVTVNDDLQQDMEVQAPDMVRSEKEVDGK